MNLLLAYLLGLATLPVTFVLWSLLDQWRLKRRFPELYRNARIRHFPEYLDR